MAEEYWNRGRREGIQQSSALDTLERVLGISSNIAGRVQANRDKREASQLQWIGALTSGFDSNYNATSVQNISDQIKEYKRNNVGKMTADTIDMFGIMESKIGGHLENLQDHDRQIKDIDALPDKAYNLVEDLANYSLQDTDEKKKQYALDNWRLEDGTVLNYSDKERELTGIMTQYASNMRNFFGRHGQRVTKTNPYLAKKYLQLEGVLVDAVDALNDGLIVPGEAQYLKSNLLNPDPDKIKNWANMQQKSVEYIDTQNRAAFTKDKAAYEFYDDALSSSFAQITEEGAAFTPGSKSDAATPLYIGEDSRSYYANLTDEDGNPMYEGAELSQMIQDSENTRKGYIVARGKSYADMESKNKIYFKKHGVDLMEGMGVEDIDVPTTITTTETVEVEDAPVSDSTNKIIGEFQEIDASPIKNMDLDIPKYTEAKRNKEKGKLDNLGRVIENYKFGKANTSFQKEVHKNLRALSMDDQGNIPGEIKHIGMRNDTYHLNALLGKGDLKWAKSGGSRLRGYSYTDERSESGFTEPANKNKMNMPITKEEVDSLVKMFDADLKKHEELLKEIALMDEASKDWATDKGRKFMEKEPWKKGPFGTQLYTYSATGETKEYEKLIQKKKEFEEKWNTGALQQLKNAKNIFYNILPGLYNQRKSSLESFLERQSSVRARMN